jgi:hypothetical protein
MELASPCLVVCVCACVCQCLPSCTSLTSHTTGTLKPPAAHHTHTAAPNHPTHLGDVCALPLADAGAACVGQHGAANLRCGRVSWGGAGGAVWGREACGERVCVCVRERVCVCIPARTVYWPCCFARVGSDCVWVALTPAAAVGDVRRRARRLR